MAFDTNVAPPSPVALEIRPPQFGPSPLELAAQYQENRLRGQQMQASQLENQQRQYQLDQTRALNDAYRNALTVGQDGTPTIDTDKLTDALGRAGHGSAIPGVLKGVVDFQKSSADLAKANGEVAEKQADYGGIVGATVKAANYDPRLFLVKAQYALQSKALPAGMVQPIMQQVTQALGQDPSGETARGLVQKIADNLIAGSPSQQKLINESTTAQARADQAKTGQQRLTAELPGIAAQNQAKTLAAAGQTIDAVSGQADYDAWRQQNPEAARRLPPAFSPAVKTLAQRLGLTAEQRTQADLAQQRETREATQGQATIALSAGRLGVERENSARMQKQFDATYGAMLDGNGKPLEPEAAKAVASQDPAAVGIANYQLAPPQASRGGPGAAILRKVMAINPQYNAQNWQAQAAMMKGFTSGSQSKEISGINTALGHVGVLGDAVTALRNGDVQLLNKIANSYQVQTGGDAVTTFKSIVHKVAPEINRAYVGGVGAQGEIMAQESDFDPKMSAQQLQSNVAMTTKLLRSKIGALENQWKQTMGSDFESRFLTPEAKAVQEKWSPAGGRRPGSLPQGGGTVIDQATAKQFYDAAGGDPAKARALATQNGWKVQ